MCTAAVLPADTEQILEAVSDTFRRKAHDLAAFSQTWIGSLANQIHYAAGQANPRVKGWRHIAILDGKTGSVCLNRHGKTWDKQGNPLGHDLNFAKPPLHINCRSRLIYVFDPDKPFDGMDGGEWVKRRSLKQLQEQFGKGVGQMLYDGEISLSDAVKSGGLVPMTLQELQDKYAVPATVRAIERKRWTPEFKAKAKQLYFDFQTDGIELDDHVISRILERSVKSKPVLTADEIKHFILSNKPNFIQDDGRLIWISDKMNMTLIQAEDGVFVTLMRKKTVKAEWKKID
ncbi:hypothetical protein [Neisseria leonii]|uniref:hypothetical protein n=1 Tax=Neisseria leonii TaxID=2995413 RepID=UPI00237AB956|nr:hypothetical protein [Neisseria sp. 3986]MDD9325201.1 phage head morphogenesis protein [Neisseria sp. 3986]